MSEVIGEDKARALYTELYKQPFHKENLSISTKKVYKSSDTEKYVYELKDNRYIETVFIKRRDGGTVCVSTKVGCSVGCIFCESGRNGFVRNLTPSEIVQQVVLIRQKVNRIVFMGMGEPLFNYDNLIAAIHILRDRNGLNFPTDGITISTVGPVNQLKKLREEHLKIQLTISYMQQHRLRETVSFLICTCTLLKMLLSKHCPILKGIIEKWYLRICFYQV